MLLLAALLSPPALAADPARAERLKTEAEAAFAEGRLEEALRLLDAAYAADPQPGLIANQGLVLDKLGRYADAVAAFERFLATQPPADKVEAARAILLRLKPEVRIESEPPGAEVRIDDGGRRLGRTPLKLYLVAGPHVVRLTHPEFQPIEQRIEVRPGEPMTVRVPLTAPVAVAAPVHTPAPRRRPAPGEADDLLGDEISTGGPSLRTWGWISLGVGAAAAGASVTMLVLGLDAIDARDGATTGAAWDDHQASAEAYNTGYLVSGGVALAALSTGLVLLLLDDGEGATVGLTPGGATIGGRF